MAAILLRELQIEIKRTLTTNALLAVLETKLSQEQGENSGANSETVIFILGKVLPKVVSTRQKNEWNRFSKVCLDLCQRVDSLELFLALRFLMGRQITS